jgi:signal peptidase I
MAKKPKRRSAFPTVERTRMPETTETYVSDQPVGGVFGFFRDFGVRETIESIVIAIVLALMFRAYEAEAFIIPTGSMAPSLQGRHMDLECANCNFRYHSGATREDATSGNPGRVDCTFCPICSYKTKIDRKILDHRSNNGDRILVNKFIYDFNEPERYDVIVFKNPNNGKQNYIKRLIGLPGDNILIENGDIYLMEALSNGNYGKRITRKPPHKLRNILQTVDDTNYIGDKLKDAGWPMRWQSFDGIGDWTHQYSEGNPVFESGKSTGENWIRYRHFQPLKAEWPTIERSGLPGRYRNGLLPAGQLIGDKYGYNDQLYSDEYATNGSIEPDAIKNLGLHWVGDIGLECFAEVRSETGKILLDLVEGGAHFICEIDVETGRALLRCDDSEVDTKVTFLDQNDQPLDQPSAQTNLKGAGDYHIEYVNADDRLHLWINNKLIEFPGATYMRTGIPVPTYSTNSPGDAEPAGVATNGAEVSISRLKVLRDIYYTSVKGRANSFNETGWPDTSQIETFQQTPSKWSSPEALKFFTQKKGSFKPMFKLEKGSSTSEDQFLPMGDNSPRSLDGRIWDGDHYVERNMLIGRAMLIYWPHTKNKPFKHFPNFERMGFIR